MIRVMSNLTINGLHHRVGFAANGYLSLHILFRERFQCLEKILPALLP
jgi:hypothetical protein